MTSRSSLREVLLSGDLRRSSGLRRASSFLGIVGGRSIGTVGSFALCFNTLVGPGVLELPRVYQKAGWLPVTCTLCAVAACSGFALTLFCDVVLRLDIHSGAATDACGRHEFSDAFRHVFGRRGFVGALALFVLCNTAQAVTAIVSTAQVADQAIAFCFSRTFALQLLPTLRVLQWAERDCPPHTALCLPFSPAGGDNDPVFILTLGYAITTLLLAPPALFSLGENIRLQFFCLFVFFALMAAFVAGALVSMASTGAEGGAHALPVVGRDCSDVAGVAVFNFTLSTAIVSWLNERKPGVNVNQTIRRSVALAVASFVLVGVLGALSTREAADNMLESFGSATMPTPVRLGAFVFGFVVIGTGIPISCIVIRYNLQLSRACSPTTATLVANVLPWLAAGALYSGHRTLDFVSWSGVVVNGLINLVLPLSLALAVALSAHSALDLAPPEASLLRPLPRWMEARRARAIGLLLALAVPGILLAMAMKTKSQFFPGGAEDAAKRHAHLS